MKTFVDTGAFCAISDSRDDFHAVATRQFSLMLKDKHPLVTTNFVVDETYTWIRYRLGAVQALQFVRKVWESEKGNPALEVVTVTRALEQRAVRLLEKFADQDISYTDATSLALIQERKLTRAFTFDRHFYTLPIEIVPGMRTER
jgi:hypothetical protein